MNLSAVIAFALIAFSCYNLVDLCWLHLLSAGHLFESVLNDMPLTVFTFS